MRRFPLDTASAVLYKNAITNTHLTAILEVLHATEYIA